MQATWYEPGDTCRTDDVTGVMLGTALAPGTIVPMIVVSVQKQTRVGTVSSVQIVKSREVIEVVNKNKQPWYVTTEKDTSAQVKNRPAFFDLDQMLNLFNPNRTRKRVSRSDSPIGGVNGTPSSIGSAAPQVREEDQREENKRIRANVPTSTIASAAKERSTANQKVREEDRREENDRLTREIAILNLASTSLIRKLDAEKKRKASTEKEMQSMKTYNNNLKSTISSLSAEKLKLQPKVKSARQSTKRLKTQLSNLGSVVVDLGNELDEASESGVATQDRVATQNARDMVATQTLRDKQEEFAALKLREMTDLMEAERTKKKNLKTANDELRAKVVEKKERTETDDMQRAVVESQQKAMDRMAEQNRTHLKEIMTVAGREKEARTEHTLFMKTRQKELEDELKNGRISQMERNLTQEMQLMKQELGSQTLSSSVFPFVGSSRESLSSVLFIVSS